MSPLDFGLRLLYCVTKHILRFGTNSHPSNAKLREFYFLAMAQDAKRNYSSLFRLRYSTELWPLKHNNAVPFSEHQSAGLSRLWCIRLMIFHTCLFTLCLQESMSLPIKHGAGMQSSDSRSGDDELRIFRACVFPDLVFRFRRACASWSIMRTDVCDGCLVWS